MKSLNLKKDETTGESYFDLSDISDFFEDVSQVDSYEINSLEEGQLSIIFYDKEGNQISLKDSGDKK